jgi:hypothetical protein
LDRGPRSDSPNELPFKFTGDLNRVVIRLSDSKLNPEDEEQIHRAKAAIAVSE